MLLLLSLDVKCLPAFHSLTEISALSKEKKNQNSKDTKKKNAAISQTGEAALNLDVCSNEEDFFLTQRHANVDATHATACS